jgi:hypothetical protein
MVIFPTSAEQPDQELEGGTAADDDDDRISRHAVWIGGESGEL